ncbi:MAG: zinc-dependent alcohol dehydrogenase [Christensenellales bacterium]
MTMKAIVRYGLENGQVEMRQVPVPGIGEGDVLIRVKAAGLCGSDLNSYRGKTVVPVPVILGHEFAGEIAAVGSRVTAWKVGDRVVSDNTGYVCGTCYACNTGEYLQCPNRKGLGSKMDGGFAEYVKISEPVLSVYPSCLMRIPDCIPFEEAAILDPACNGYNAVIQQGGLTPGESVAVFGVGPIGLGCIAAAKVGGAVNIIAVVRKSTRELHRNVAQAMGATHIVEQDNGDAVKAIRDITRGEGVALTLDSAGANELFPLSVDITRLGGKIVRLGYDWAPLGYSLNLMTNRNISLVGHMGYNPIAWKNVIRLMEAGMLGTKQTITHRLPLEQFEEGIRLMSSREAIKVVFYP